MIMIVDDNASMRGLIRRFVQTFDSRQEFYECQDGREALDAFPRLKPEWILMDIKMPRMDGLTATKAIRAKYPEARIIIVSDFDDPELKTEARRSGAAGHVLKERLFELRDLMRCQVKSQK